MITIELDCIDHPADVLGQVVRSLEAQDIAVDSVALQAIIHGSIRAVRLTGDEDAVRFAVADVWASSLDEADEMLEDFAEDVDPGHGIEAYLYRKA